MIKKMKEETIICPYCDNKAVFTSSKRIYGGRDYGMIYLCETCGAYCGVHKGTAKPLGSLANAELRYWRKNAHSAFDPIWKSRVKSKDKVTGKIIKKGPARRYAYSLLASILGIDEKDCHIGMFDVDMCKRVVDIFHNINGGNS